MSAVLFTNGNLLDPTQPELREGCDVLVEDGVVKERYPTSVSIRRRHGWSTPRVKPSCLASSTYTTISWRRS